MQYVICEIGSRQYLIKPGQILEVDKLPEGKTWQTNKVLAMVDQEKVEIGKPYVGKTLEFEVLGNVKKPKVRVAVYKAKANYRRVTGIRPVKTQIKLIGESAVKKG